MRHGPPLAAVLAAAGAAVALAAAVALGGCGSSSQTTSSTGPRITIPGTPVWCPSRQLSPNARTTGSFDARILLGRGEQQAKATTERNGCAWRVVRRDGVALAVTADVNTRRLDATVVRGIVTAVAVY